MRVNTFARAAPPRSRIAARARDHVRGVNVVARELQRIVGLDGAAHVQVAAVIQRPAAVLRLMGAQIGRDLRLEHRIDLVQEVHHHDVLGGDGAVRLELETANTLQRSDERSTRRGRRRWHDPARSTPSW